MHNFDGKKGTPPPDGRYPLIGKQWISKHRWMALGIFVATNLKLVAFERWDVRKDPSGGGKIVIFQTESVISKMLWHSQWGGCGSKLLTSQLLIGIPATCSSLLCCLSKMPPILFWSHNQVRISMLIKVFWNFTIQQRSQLHAEAPICPPPDRCVTVAGVDFPWVFDSFCMVFFPTYIKGGKPPPFQLGTIGSLEVFRVFVCCSTKNAPNPTSPTPMVFADKNGLRFRTRSRKKRMVFLAD